MKDNISRDDLNQILDEFNYNFETIIQELEILRDFIAVKATKMKKLCSIEPRKTEYELTEEQVTEAAVYAAMEKITESVAYVTMEKLRREIRDPYEPPDSSGYYDDEDSMIEVRRLDEREVD